jgi:hypothetical protein
MVSSVKPVQLEQICNTIPAEWMPDHSAGDLLTLLQAVISSSYSFAEKINLLREIPPESEEEIRRKNQRARKAFMDKFGEI